MSKRRLLGYTKRTLAFLLTAVMIFTTVDSSVLTAYATNGDSTVVVEQESTMPVETESISEVEESSVMETEDVSTEPESVENAIVETSVVEENVEQETYFDGVTVYAEEGNNDTYLGTEDTDSDGRATLSISASDMENAGIEFSETAILEILNTKVTEGKRYGSIGIGYDTYADKISKDIWNTVASLMVTDDENDTFFNVYFEEASAPEEWWTFNNITNGVTDDVKVGVTLTVSEENENAIINFENTTFNSDYVRVVFVTDKSEGKIAYFNSYKNVFGTQEANFATYDSEGNCIYRSGGLYDFYESEEYDYNSSASLYFWYVKEYSANTDYTVCYPLPYAGDEYTNSDGTTGLNIAESSMEEGTDFNTRAVEILAAKDKKYDSVNLYYSSTTDTIPATTWNACVNALNEGGGLRASFYAGSGLSEEWYFSNPIVRTDAMKLGASMTPSETELGGVSVSLDSDNSAAGMENYAYFAVSVSDSATDYEAYVNAVGTTESELEVKDADGNLVVTTLYPYGKNYYYDYGTSSQVQVYVYGVNAMKAGSRYTLSEKVYRGDVNEWDDNGYTVKSLSLDPNYVEKDSFSVDDVTAIMKNYSEKYFDYIYITYYSDNYSNQVSKEVINALLPYVKTTTNDRGSGIGIRLKNKTTLSEVEWYMYNVAEQTEDQTLSAAFDISESEVIVTVGAQTLQAGQVNLYYYINNANEAEKVAILKSLLGDGATNQRLNIGSSDAYGDWYSYDYRSNISISDVNKLTPDKEYEITKYKYIGNISIWDGENYLYIGAMNNPNGYLTAFTEDELLEILSYYSTDDKLDYVQIEQPWTCEESDVIYKSVADKAADLFADHGTIQFMFRDPKTWSMMRWDLHNVSASVEQTADQMVSASFFAENNKTYLSVGEQVLNVGNDGYVSLYHYISRTDDSKWANEVINVLGENYLSVAAVGSKATGWYNTDEYGVFMNLNNIQFLEPGVEYQIAKEQYYGFVDTSDGETTLYLNSGMVGADAFTLDEIKAVVEYYNANNMKFNRISVEQTSSSKKVIKKDFINALRELLIDPDASGNFVNFIFAQNEHIEGETVFSNVHWYFDAPGVATKDINANITLENKKGEGLSVKLNKNTYNAQYVTVEYVLSDTSKVYTDTLIPALGVAGEDSDFLSVLEKGSTLRQDIWAVYSRSEENGIAFLTLSNVGKWTAGIDNRLVKSTSISEIFCVDIDKEIEPQRTPDGNVTWTSLTPDVVSITSSSDGKKGVVRALKAYADQAAVMASYSSGEESYLEVYSLETGVGVSGVRFAKEDITIEWDGTSEISDFLKVYLTPASIQNQVNPQGFEWFVENERVTADHKEGNAISFEVFDYEYNGEIVDKRTDGQFMVTNYGTSVVRVRCGDAEDTCTIHVVKPLEIPEYVQIFAIPSVYATLADVDLDAQMGTEEGTWEWENPNISIAPYANVDNHIFSAIYTKDGRSAKTSILVDMIHVEDLYIGGLFDAESKEPFGLDGYYVYENDELLMTYVPVLNYMSYDDNQPTQAYKLFLECFEKGKLKVEWSSKEKLEEITHSGYDSVVKYVGAGKTGKKAFTVSLINTMTGKAIAKGNTSVTLIKDSVFNFENPDVFKFEDVKKDEMNGTFKFTVPKDDYKKLTVKSMDTSLLKLAQTIVNEPTAEYDYYVITVDYTFKKYGKTLVTVTAADELKSTTYITCERINTEPEILESSFTLDKSWTGYDDFKTKDQLSVVYQESAGAAGDVSIKEDEYKNKISLVKNDDGTYSLILDDTNLANKTYKLTLLIPVVGKEQPYEKEIKVKVTESKPKVKVKQTQKVNEFYIQSADSDDGMGILNVDAGKYTLSSFKPLDESSPFEVSRIEESNSFEIRIKAGKDPAATEKTEFAFRLYNKATNETYYNTLIVSVKTENKAPALVLSSKKNTIYPNADIWETSFTVTSKATNEGLTFVSEKEQVKLVLNKKTGETYSLKNVNDTVDSYKVGKNNYYVSTEDFTNAINIAMDTSKIAKATDKFTFRIQMDNWSKPVDVSYSVTVNVKTPTLALGNKTLTLNMNEAIYDKQREFTGVNISGVDNIMLGDVWAVGTNAASASVLHNNLHISHDYGMSELVVNIVDKGNAEAGTQLKAGTYKYTVYARLDNGLKLSQNLTVKVVDKPVEKSIKVTKKGSIDVLRRDTTQITMNPKLSGISGEVVGFTLKGDGACVFDAGFDNGNCVVKAMDGCSYSTKISYSVTPVYVLSTGDDTYEVEGPKQTIKVTQGKPKLTLSSASKTLYADKNNELTIDFAATLKDETIDIAYVELLNYTNDLSWSFEDNALTISANDEMFDITKSKGNYTLKFAVYYLDKAGNEKAAQASYKVTIVR